MRYNKSVMLRQSVLSVVVLFLFQQIRAFDKQGYSCPPSSCGKITNISYPFRLKGDPKYCSESRYELACENSMTVLYLFSGKYYVQAINYNNFTIRVVDPGFQHQNCSSLPRHFLSLSNFSDTDDKAMNPYQATQFAEERTRKHVFKTRKLVFKYIVFLNCSNQVTNNRKYVDTAPCIDWQPKGHGHVYAIAGDLKAKDFEVGCYVKLVGLTSWWGLDTNEYSYTLMHKALVYGFEISWMRLPCQNKCGQDYCYVNSSSKTLQCFPRPRSIFDATGIWELLKIFARVTAYIAIYIVSISWACKILFGVPLIIAFSIYKWRRRHLSMFESIENYLEQNNLMPIRYSYKQIKKMGGSFVEKLGEGGYGSVFKGKLRSGPFVAIKILGKSKSNGQDFINEVATIGRTHHQNVVKLIGFCVEGSKRILVYEFMPNGSLDKFIFSKDGTIHLSYDKIYNISIGVARGISYLHHGCEMQILHFDIKPHNILLDEKFIPKVSDFGLAKLFPINHSIVTMTGVRGTIGYMAPELFYKNIGGISHKADVYSFGMLLMEMASKRKNLNPHAECSSQLYFPFWVYNHLAEEKDIEMENVTDEEKKIAKKMIIVALWCIQLKPNDRPSMSKVVEMLEGDMESLEIPQKPTLYPHETMTGDQTMNSNQSISSD